MDKTDVKIIVGLITYFVMVFATLILIGCFIKVGDNNINWLVPLVAVFWTLILFKIIQRAC